MIDCTFKLNGKPMSTFVYGATSFPAFSGKGDGINNRFSVCLPNQGPIPIGTYYIFDRQSSGLFGALRDLFNGRDQWFALYAIDGKIDDETYCKKVKRGQFRLHPKGPLGISEGCITINTSNDYMYLRSMLKSANTEIVAGIGLEAYGKVKVR
ncbi:MAG: DUF2778 domain-containing protein [Nitrospirota bacterium]|nr:DUF2778 domain-containing protein [Nitrospirota bacterium]